VHRRRRSDGDGRRTALSTVLAPTGDLLLFAAAVAVLNATPGVDVVLTVSRTLQRGAKAGVAAALGINTGCVLHALAAAFGLAALLALHRQAFALIQWAGAGYLAWLGLGLLRRAWRGQAAGVAAGAAAGSHWDDFCAGLLTNVLNPKVALFFLAFLPQFVPAGAPAKTLSFLLLGAWFVVQSLLFLLTLVAVAGWLARRQAPPALRRWLGAAGGLLFVGLALRLLRARPLAT
jgi:threonine/homoserine/homoserine lactone efflux protein